MIHLFNDTKSFATFFAIQSTLEASSTIVSYLDLSDLIQVSTLYNVQIEQFNKEKVNLNGVIFSLLMKNANLATHYPCSYHSYITRLDRKVINYIVAYIGYQPIVISV